MKIIKITSPQAATGAKEQLTRVLTFPDGAYALHFVDKRGMSKLDLFASDGSLIQGNVNAESAYIFENGDYILLYEPTNMTAGAGKARFRREYRMFARSGRLMFDDISCFIPHKGNWYTLLQNGVKNLYDDKCNRIDCARNLTDFVKFDGGYARVEFGGDAKIAPLSEHGYRWLPYNSRLKNLMKNQSEWLLCNEKGCDMYTVKNVTTLFGGGYAIAPDKNGKLIFYYPNGVCGWKTTLSSGARKNIACLTHADSAKAETYRLSHARNGSYKLPDLADSLTDIHEFDNGCFSGVLGDRLCFFQENEPEPTLAVPASENCCFLPDGSHWNAKEKVLYGLDGTVKAEYVNYVADLGCASLVSRYEVQTLYGLDGKVIADNVQFVGKTNGIFAVRGEHGLICLLNRSGRPIVPPLPEDSLSRTEQMF